MRDLDREMYNRKIDEIQKKYHFWRLLVIGGIMAVVINAFNSIIGFISIGIWIAIAAITNIIISRKAYDAVNKQPIYDDAVDY